MSYATTISCFAVLLVLLLSVYNGVAADDIDAIAVADWSSFEEKESILTGDMINIISTLPITHYFDKAKGKYKTGIIGDHVNQSHPELVQVVERRDHRSGTLDISYSIDTSALFIHLLGGIQYINHLHEAATNDSFNLDSSFSSIENELEQYESILTDSPSSTIATKKDIVVLNTSLITSNIDLLRARQNRTESSSALYLEKLFNLKSNSFESYSNLGQQHLSNLSNIEAKYKKILLDGITSAFRDEERLELESLEEIHNSSINALERKLIARVSAIEFRTLEKSRIEREVEGHKLKLMSAKNEFLIEGLEKLTSVIFEAVNGYVHYLAANPTLVFRGLVAALVTIVGITIVMELFRVMLSMFKASYSKKLLFPIHQPVNRSESKVTSSLRLNILQGHVKVAKNIDKKRYSTIDSFSKSYLVVDKSVCLSILDIIENYQNLSSQSSAPQSMLPHAFITGNSGLGKTALSNFIARYSLMPHIIMSGGDLQRSLDSTVIQYFKNLLTSFRKSKSKLLIIIDDFDLLMNSCNSDPNAAVNIYINEFLYLLLDFMDASTRTCVLLTSVDDRITFDSAILDRMDSMIRLGDTSWSLRLDFIIMKVHEHLYSFFGPSNAQIVDNLVEGVSRESKEYSEITNFVDSLKSMLGFSAEVFVSSSKFSKFKFSNLGVDGKEDFELMSSIGLLVLCSDKWSLRDVGRVISSVRTEVLGSESCKASTDLWRRELMRVQNDRLSLIQNSKEF